MVKPVSLSDPAFAALRQEKQENESDSDVVLRLLREAKAARKDPWHFVRTRKLRKRIMTPEEHLAFIERMREVDREQMRERWDQRQEQQEERQEQHEEEDEDDP